MTIYVLCNSSGPVAAYTDEDLAIAIRASSERNYVLAEKLGVTASVIWQVRHNKTWRDL